MRWPGCGAPIPASRRLQALDRAIGHIVELQRCDGSFGVWSDSDDTVPWLDAYATDFLLRAKEHGKAVPDYALKAALGWLRDFVRQQHTDAKSLPAMAYAHYVLARAKAGELPALRYFNDTQLAELPTQLAKAQLAAALAAYGDTTRAAAAYAAALGPPPKRPAGLRYIDYGSDLRDSAGLARLCRRQPGDAAAADGGDGPDHRAVRPCRPHQHAGRGLAVDGGRGGGARNRRRDDCRRRRCGAAETQRAALFPPRARRRRGAGVGRQSRDGAGVAHGLDHRRAQGRPAGREQRLLGQPHDLPCRTARRPIWPRCGRPISSSSSSRASAATRRAPRGPWSSTCCRPGSRSRPRRSSGQPAGNYPWLKDLTDTAYTEERDDRYIAALDLGDGNGDFTLAYVVRAVTPGEFKYPALVVEDMYEPETSGRTAIGTLSVQPR